MTIYLNSTTNIWKKVKKMWLQIRLYLLLGLMFAIVYAMIAVVASSMGISSFTFYGVLASGMILVQYMIGPKIVEWSMRIRYISESEYPSLHRMVAEMAQKAKIPEPRIGIANVPIPNAFAFGRWKSDGRVCVTEQILRLLSPDKDKSGTIDRYELMMLSTQKVKIGTDKIMELMSTHPNMLKRIHRLSKIAG
jgi:Zn-dependent protease with chaperone function